VTMPSIERRVIDELIEIGRSGVPAVPQSLADERTAWRILTGSRQAWEQVGTGLSDEDLRSLIQGLIHYARSSGRTIGGSVSPVITLYREVVSRVPVWEPELTAWIVEHRTNPYEPFGGVADVGTRSWAEYSARQAERHARGAANMRAEAERQAVDRERRRVREAAEATARLAAAVRRGDLAAVKSLLDKGGDAAAALPGGASLVEWAEQHGRVEVAGYLRERSTSRIDS